MPDQRYITFKARNLPPDTLIQSQPKELVLHVIHVAREKFNAANGMKALRFPDNITNCQVDHAACPLSLWTNGIVSFWIGFVKGYGKEPDIVVWSRHIEDKNITGGTPCQIKQD